MLQNTLCWTLVSAFLFLFFVSEIANASPLANLFRYTRTDEIHKPHWSNPCISQCVDDPTSEACAECCTSVSHEVDWKCYLVNSPESVKCCDKENWDPECWDHPSESNNFHSCSMCCGECSDAFGGCGGCPDLEGDFSCGDFEEEYQASRHKCELCDNKCSEYCLNIGDEKYKTHYDISTNGFVVHLCCSCGDDDYCKSNSKCQRTGNGECVECHDYAFIDPNSVAIMFFGGSMVIIIGFFICVGIVVICIIFWCSYCIVRLCRWGLRNRKKDTTIKHHKSQDLKKKYNQISKTHKLQTNPEDEQHLLSDNKICKPQNFVSANKINE